MSDVEHAYIVSPLIGNRGYYETFVVHEDVDTLKKYDDSEDGLISNKLNLILSLLSADYKNLIYLKCKLDTLRQYVETSDEARGLEAKITDISSTLPMLRDVYNTISDHLGHDTI